VSYNEEGLLEKEQIGGILALFAGTKAYNFRRDMRRISYKRFRSDSDRGPEHERGPRRYRVVEGRRPDELHEWLLFARRAGVAAPRSRAVRAQLQETR
jgi:hypothetical protein